MQWPGCRIYYELAIMKFRARLGPMLLFFFVFVLGLRTWAELSFRAT